MEDIIIRILMNGGPSGVIVGIGLYIVKIQINGLRDSINELKENKQWANLCNEKHKEVERRFGRLEDKLNGG